MYRSSDRFSEYPLDHWSRFIVKQTHERLQPNPAFARHHAASPARAGLSKPIHSENSTQYGWTWHEMGFFVQWKPLTGTTVLCFDLPQALQTSVQAALGRDPGGKVYSSDPYSLFAVLIEELLSLYDASVWSIRNHICDWEVVCHPPFSCCPCFSTDRFPGPPPRARLPPTVRDLQARYSHQRNPNRGVEVRQRPPEATPRLHTP